MARVKYFQKNKSLLIFQEGQPAGYVRYLDSGYELNIEMIFIRKSLRRQGLGQLLLTELLRRFTGRQYILEVRINNTPAIELYKKNGFKLNRVRKEYYKDGQNAWEMIQR